MKKICIVVPDGTGIRNYLFSNLIHELQKLDIEISILHSISENAIDEIKKVHNIVFKVHELPIYKEGYFQKFLRETICYARLLHNKKFVKNETILTNWKPNKRNFKHYLFYKVVELYGSFISKNYKRILKLEQKHTKLTAKNCKVQKELLKKINPDIIFSTHQRAMNPLPLINAAKQLKIKTIGAIFSWDNLPKARLTLRTDKYIVWSDYMKRELNLYYPEINNEAIAITGTPQFEFYYDESFIVEKESFFQKYNLDSSKKIICFSGDDERTSPYDPLYLNDLASIIHKEKLNIQILLRRAPVDTSGRFDKIVSKYSDIIKEAAPLWNFDKNQAENWQIIYPKYSDIDLLVSTVFYCDAVINVGSTMAHDFSMFNKPAIYINYNSTKSSDWNIETIYKYQHFRSMGDLKPVFWLNSKDEIKQILTDVFELKMNDNKKWLDVISKHREDASLRIAKTLVSCI